MIKARKQTPSGRPCRKWAQAFQRNFIIKPCIAATDIPIVAVLDGRLHCLHGCLQQIFPSIHGKARHIGSLALLVLYGAVPIKIHAVSRSSDKRHLASCHAAGNTALLNFQQIVTCLCAKIEYPLFAAVAIIHRVQQFSQLKGISLTAAKINSADRLQLSRLLRSGETNEFYQLAIRCYIHGDLPCIASIAMKAPISVLYLAPSLGQFLHGELNWPHPIGI